MSRSAQDGSSAERVEMPIRQNLDGAGPPVAMQWPRFTRWQRLVFGLSCWRGVGMLVAALGLVGALPGCMGPVAKAPYARRLGSGEAGSLIGPFDGQVIDQSTVTPLSSALVIGTWAFQEAGGIAVPESAYSVTTVTGSDGSYSLPSLPAGRQFAGLLRRFTLVVYKAGFVGYRSDVRFDDRSPRHDFVQRGNVVRLDRFPQGESHARHLVFLGSGAALRGAAQAEIIQAGLELQESAPQLVPDPTVTLAPPAASESSGTH